MQGVWGEDPALASLHRVRMEVAAGFHELWEQERYYARQQGHQHINHPQIMQEAQCQALVPVPGSPEFDEWSRLYGMMTNINQPVISEAFAARVRTAMKRLNVINGHLLVCAEFNPVNMLQL